MKLIIILSLLIIGFSIGLVGGLAINSTLHSCPTPVMPTRAEVQIFLKENYWPSLVVDGFVGSNTNSVWNLYEKDLMNRDMADYINRMGGIEVNP